MKPGPHLESAMYPLPAAQTTTPANVKSRNGYRARSQPGLVNLIQPL